MPEDADSEQHVGMRPSLSPPPLNAPIPSKGPLLPSEESRSADAGPLTNGSSAEDRPRINGLKSPEDDKIQEYLQRSDTAVIFPEPVGGKSPKEEKGCLTPDTDTEPKVSPDGSLKCPLCEQVFPGGQQALNELKEHLTHSHKKGSYFTCQKCNLSFTSKACLTKHRLLHNTNGQVTKDDEQERKFKCPQCGKGFKYKHHLIEHLRIHSGEKPFICQYCGRKFSHSGSFSSHRTSKKCLIVNLKVRKVDGRSPRGRGSTQNNSFRPIIPKFESSGGVGGEAPAASEAPLLPAGYMPSSERFPGYSGRLQQPYLPLTFHHPLLNSTPHYPHLSLGPFPEVTHLLQQRRLENDSDPLAHSQLQPHLLSSPSSLTVKPGESPPASPKPPTGELNAVKKILEIVDATVTKQQKSPTRPQRNGLLSELLSAAPHPIIKCPPSPFGASLDARCRFCSRLFDSKVDLYQHERYLCQRNAELRSPKAIGSDGESCEESTCVSSSPSALSVDCVLTLKAHHQIRKGQMVHWARNLKCSESLVEEFFHKPVRSKDYHLLNGHESDSPTFPASSCNGHPFQSAVVPPHPNGAIPSCAQVVPFRPIAERSPRLVVVEEDQPLDLSVKTRREDPEGPTPSDDRVDSPPGHCDSGEVLNLSQRSSRTPPKVSSPYSNNSRNAVVHQPQPQNEDSLNNNLHSSLLYKYMQIGISNHRLSPPREKSPVVETQSSPSHVKRPHPIASPSGTTGTDADRSISPSASCGSCCHTDEPGNGITCSPTASKKGRLCKRGQMDVTTIEDSRDSSSASGKTRKSWKRHKVSASEEGMYACDQCDKMFTKQSSLARHTYEHSGLRPHVCDECCKAFKHKHHLTEHKRLHSGEKPFQCSKCHKRFSHSGSYSQHMNHRYDFCKPYHN